MTITEYSNLNDMRREVDKFFHGRPDILPHDRKVVLDVSQEERNKFYENNKEQLLYTMQHTSFSPGLPDDAKEKLLSGEIRLTEFFIPGMAYVTIKNANDVS